MNKIGITEKQVRIGLILALSLICITTFSLQIWKGYPDIPDHNRFVSRWLSGSAKEMPYSLYYLVILVITFFQNNLMLINGASIVILTLSVIGKFIFSGLIFKRELAADFTDRKQIFQIGIFNLDLNGLILLLVFLICLAENLIYKPSATMSLGYLPVNTWHNSTTIFLVPIATLLFYRSCVFINEQNEKSNNYIALPQILLLTIFTIFIKPSYFFVFSITFPLYFLLRFGINRNLFYTILNSAISSFALLIVYRFVYVGSDSSVSIDPFLIWSHWSTNIPMSLLSSILFPLLFLIFYFRQALGDHILCYAWLQMIVAMLIYILLAETGVRAMHGNFAWQTIVCNYILFFSTWILYLRILLDRKKLVGKDRILIFCFLMHVGCGILFLIKLPIFGAR